MNMPATQQRKSIYNERYISPILTANEASKLVGISQTTIVRWVKADGKLGYYNKWIKKYMIFRERLLDVVEQKMVKKYLRNTPVKVLRSGKARGVRR